jgi:hypothetical protein
MVSTCVPVAPAPPEQKALDTSAFPATQAAFRAIRRQPLRALAASAIVLIPCFWHHRIQATDLGSHLYNAWLAQLIRQGAAPGLHIVPQSSNVLFDLILSGLFNTLGPVAAEHIAVSLTVLIFFWGAFALCSAAADGPAWRVTPLIALTCYGFMFNMGFLNLYLSVGLSLFAMAVLWRGRRWDYILLAPLVVLIWMAHLLGTGGLFALGGFLLVGRWLPLRYQLGIFGLLVVGYFAALWYVAHHFYIIARETNLYWMMGTDQFVLYSLPYAWVSVAVMALCAVIVALSWHRDRGKTLRSARVWIQVYLLMALTVYLAPGGIFHPKLQMMGYLPDRASLYTAALLCALMAALKPARWQAVALGVAALAFFGLLYRDTGLIDKVEDKVDAAVANLKPGDRVVATFFPWYKSRIHDQHMIDRACIGHCYYYANYEPSSGQFRIKADTGNRIVATSIPTVISMQMGHYVVQPADLPLIEIYACGNKLENVCLRELHAGEMNGQAAADELNAASNKAR